MTWPAPDFQPAELRCKGCLGKPCGQDPDGVQRPALALLQALRTAWGGPLSILSAYRCPLHNARVGGAPLSRHKLGDAFDVATPKWSVADRERLVGTARSVGFRGVGLYRTFVHVDLGKARNWQA